MGDSNFAITEAHFIAVILTSYRQYSSVQRSRSHRGMSEHMSLPLMGSRRMYSQHSGSEARCELTRNLYSSLRPEHLKVFHLSFKTSRRHAIQQILSDKLSETFCNIISEKLKLK